MHTDIIKTSWNELAGRRLAFIEAFYDRLFERYPRYRELFPGQMDAQHERMIEMIGTLAQFVDHIPPLEPYLSNVGFQHRRTGIRAADVENFKNVFLETLAGFPTAIDPDAQRAAWQTAFDEVIIPLFDQGLERGRDQA